MCNELRQIISLARRFGPGVACINLALHVLHCMREAPFTLHKAPYVDLQ